MFASSELNDFAMGGPNSLRLSEDDNLNMPNSQLPSSLLHQRLNPNKTTIGSNATNQIIKSTAVHHGRSPALLPSMDPTTPVDLRQIKLTPQAASPAQIGHNMIHNPKALKMGMPLMTQPSILQIHILQMM